jgi:glyoxylase-like metal-dependent hydrolase (beta-lactamase superfamily II)
VSEPAPVWICATCGNHYPEAEEPPQLCVICADERQWVPADGQRWTTAAELGEAGFRGEFRELEPSLVGIGVEPKFAIGQRALLVRTSQGNLLWDPPTYLDDDVVGRIQELGGVRVVSASHPHFYGSMVQCGRTFDAEILVPEVDLGWLTRPDPAVRTWSGVEKLLPGLTLVQCGGHFPGSAVVHWADGADGAGALLVGDTLFVTPGEDRVSFAWSAPNRIPLPEHAVRGVLDALRPYRFDRIYAGWWEQVLRQGARHALETSAERYIRFLRGEVEV